MDSVAFSTYRVEFPDIKLVLSYYTLITSKVGETGLCLMTS